MINRITQSHDGVSIKSPLEDNHKSNSSQEMMGKDQFLKLLVTQLSKQDPLNPVSDTQFIAQMAQFSSLEQMMKVGESTEKVSKSLQRLEAQGMVGSFVEFQEESGTLQRGMVQGISAYSNNILLRVDEKVINFSDVTSVSLSIPQEQSL